MLLGTRRRAKAELRQQRGRQSLIIERLDALLHFSSELVMENHRRVQRQPQVSGALIQQNGDQLFRLLHVFDALCPLSRIPSLGHHQFV
nr:hypothetical protein [Seongchinamella sediminis]